MDFVESESNDNTTQEKSKVSSARTKLPVKQVKGAVCLRKEKQCKGKPCKQTQGAPKRCLTLLKPLTKNINPKYSKTRLPFSNTKPTLTKLPRPCPNSPPEATKAKEGEPPATDASPTVVEKHSLKLFDAARLKIQDIQRDFMVKCENLKEIKALKPIGYYKYVRLVLNDHCKLVVSDDDMMRLPKNIPPEFIGDLKEVVRLCVESGLSLLYEHLKDMKMSKNEVECRHQAECTRELLAQNHENKVLDLMTQVDLIFKDTPGHIDIYLSNTLHDLQETQHFAKVLERTVIDYKKQSAEERVKAESAHRSALEEVKKQRDDLEKTLKKQINEHKVQYDRQSNIMGNNESLIERKNNDIRTMKRQVNNLNAGIRELTGRVEYIDEQLITTRANVRNKSATISILHEQLQEIRTHIYKLQTVPLLEMFSSDDKDHIIVELQVQAKSLKARNIALESEIHKRQLAEREFNELQIKHRHVLQELELMKAQLNGNTELHSLSENAADPEVNQ